METSPGDYRQYEFLQSDPPSVDTRPLGLAAISLENMELASTKNSRKASRVEKGLRREIIGQESAIESIATALSVGEFRNRKRPIANLLFTGPTGVGKSEMAKTLAVLLNGNDEAFLKIDCSQFSHGHENTALTGSPPSFVGGDQQPMFNKSIIENNTSVILFDELEKADRKFHNLLLQILDDGEITLLQGGEKVSFRNSIIIATSNSGSREIGELVGGKKIGFMTQSLEDAVSQKKIEEVSFEALKKDFSPEFIGRFDDIVTFSPLNDSQFGEVLERHIRELNMGEASLSRGIELRIMPDLKEKIVTGTARRDQLGARPVIRNFERTVWREYAEVVLSGNIPRDSTIYAATSQDQDSNRVADFHIDRITMESAMNEQDLNGMAFAARSSDSPSFIKKIDHYKNFKSGK